VCIIAERKNVHHSIISSLDSNDNVELEAAIYAASLFAAKSKYVFTFLSYNRVHVAFDIPTNGWESRHSECYVWVFDCRSFAGGVCGKLSEMLDRTSVPLDIKLKLVSIFERMKFDPDNYEKVCFVGCYSCLLSS